MYDKETVVAILRKEAERNKVLSDVYYQAVQMIVGTKPEKTEQIKKRELPSVAYKIGY